MKKGFHLIDALLAVIIFSVALISFFKLFTNVVKKNSIPNTDNLEYLDYLEFVEKNIETLTAKISRLNTSSTENLNEYKIEIYKSFSSSSKIIKISKNGKNYYISMSEILARRSQTTKNETNTEDDED